MSRNAAIIAATLLAGAAAVFAIVNAPNVGPDFKPIVPAPGYEHDRWKTTPRDIVTEFRAYITSFDSADDNDGDGTPDKWAIPEWVSYEMRKLDGPLGPAPGRPSKWITIPELFQQGIAPSDDSYHFPQAWRTANPDHPLNDFDRGHMCMKQHAFRLGADADWNTHTVLNACPQKKDLNSGIWQRLENQTAAWADEYGKVWIICGPVVFNHKPKLWLFGPEGEGDDEVPVAIPDAFFKIVVKDREGSNVPDVLAFLFPQKGVDYSHSRDGEFLPHLTSVDTIEALTGLDFFTVLPSAGQEAIEEMIAVELWN